MKVINETPTHIIYEDYYDGQPIQFLKDKKTNEIKVNGEDLQKCLGCENLNDKLAIITLISEQAGLIKLTSNYD